MGANYGSVARLKTNVIMQLTKTQAKKKEKTKKAEKKDTSKMKRKKGKKVEKAKSHRLKAISPTP